MITDDDMARIDAENDRFRAVADIMMAGGFTFADVLHGTGNCPPLCLPCANARYHEGCYGCPDC